MDKHGAPDISIIIVHYHAAEYLEKCLRSIHVHAGGLSFEIIVVDNGSRGREIDELGRMYAGVKVLSNRENLGFVAGNNQGVDASTAEVLLLLNPDAELTEGAMLTLHRYLSTHPSCGVVGPQLIYPDGKLQHSHFPFPGLLAIATEHLVSARLMKAAETVRTLFPREKKVDVIRGTCMMIPRKTMERVGGLNRKLFMFSEESDFCFKLRNLGMECVFLPGAKVIHHESRSMKSAPDAFVMYHYYRSRILFLRENYPPGRAALCVSVMRFSLQMRRILFGVVRAQGKRRSVTSLLRELAPLFTNGS